jgi:hypothetical protein
VEFPDNGVEVALMLGRKLAGVVVAGALAGVLGGCDTHEKHVYASTPSVPQTVALRDITTGELVWSYDVPPGQELKLWFRHPENRANAQGFDELVWVVGEVGKGVPPNQNRMRVPPPMSRRIEGSVRPPETQRATLAPRG